MCYVIAEGVWLLSNTDGSGRKYSNASMLLEVRFSPLCLICSFSLSSVALPVALVRVPLDEITLLNDRKSNVQLTGASAIPST